MKALCRYFAITVFSLIALLWIALQTEGVQLWARAQVISKLEEATGYDVSIKEINGFPPFYVGLEEIEFFEKAEDANHLPLRSKKVLSIDSLHFIPAWFDLFFGKVSFFYLSADKIDLTHLPDLKTTNTAADSFKDLLPNTSFSAYLVQFSNIIMPRSFSKPLLNDFHDDQDLNIHYAMHGNIYWNPQKNNLKTTVTIVPTASNTTPGLLKIAFKAVADETTAIINIEARKAPAGSIFITLPSDQLSFKCDLSAKTSSILNALETETLTALFSGKWSLSGTKQAQKKAFSSFFRFSSEGTFSAKEANSLSFSIENINFYELTPNIDMAHSEHTALLSTSLDDKSRGFSRVDKSIAGTIQGNIHLSMVEKEPKINLQFNSENFRFEAIELSSFSTSLHVLKQQNEWQGSFDLNSSLRHYGKNNSFPIKGSGKWTTDAHTEWNFQHLDLSICEYPIAGDLQVQLYPLSIQGKLSNSSSDISLLAKQLGLEAQGKADLTINCSQSPNEPLAASTIKILLNYQDLQSNNFSKIQGQFKSEISLDEKSPPSPFSFTIQGENRDKEYSVKMEGALSSAEISIKTLLAQIDKDKFQNEQPIIFKFLPKSLYLEPMTISSATGVKISAQLNKTKKTVQASVSADNFPLEILNGFFTNTRLLGSCSGHIELAGTVAAPKLSCTFASSEFQYWNSSQSQPLLLMTSGKIEIVDEIFEGEIELQGPSVKRPIEFSGAFPLKFSLAPFSFSIPKNNPMKASLQGEIGVDHLFSSFIEETESIEGVIAVDIQANGTISQPKFSGQIAWNQGTITLPHIGSEITQIQMKGRLENEKLIIESISGSDGKKGLVTGTGKASLSPEQMLSYELSCIFSDFEIINIDEAIVEAKATTTLSGNLKEAILSGKVEATAASFFISSDLSSPLPELEITYVNDSVGGLEEQKRFHFNFDLDISIPGNGIISGMGLESEWKGQLHLTGKNKNLLLNGLLVATKGHLEFGGKQFSLEQAKIEFKGDPLSKSQLNIIASLNANQIITKILLRGPLESPRIDFQSTPSMSQKEILSWVLFNKGSSEISPLEGIQLAQVLLKLKGNSQSIDLLEKFKQQIGIDRIDIGTPSSIAPRQQDSFSNEVSVQVGKYLSEGVIVTLSKDVSNEVNRIGVEANITKNIIAEANVGDDSEAQVSLQWKINY